MESIKWKKQEEVKKYHKKYRKNNKKIYTKSQKKYADKKRPYYRNKNKEHNSKNLLNGYSKLKQQQWANKNKDKIKAHNIVNKNKLKGTYCKICNSKKNLEAHHSDYSKPTKIITLCRNHHIEKHKK